MVGEKVLVIDDRPENMELLMEYLLQPDGYIPVLAASGEEGLHKALIEKADLIILDLKMPQMSGLEVLEALRERGCTTPVIMVTAYGSEKVVQRALRLGVTDYITRPFELDAMREAIDRVLCEERLRREKKQRLQQMERRVAELSTLYSVGKALIPLVNSEEALNHLVVETAMQLTGAEEGYLLLLDEGNGHLHMRAARDLKGKCTRDFKLKVEDSVPGRVVRTGKPILFNRLDREQRFRIRKDYLVKALLNVPVKVGDRVVGVLGVDNRLSDKRFTREDMHLLSALADYAAMAIENSRLYTEVNRALARRVEELSSLQVIAQELNTTLQPESIAELTLTQARRMTDAEMGAVALTTEGRPEDLTWITQDYPYHEPDAQAKKAIYRTITTRQVNLHLAPQRLSEEEVRSQLTVPIYREGKALGALHLESPRPHAFSEESLRPLQVLAYHTAVALENARLFEIGMKEQDKLEQILRSIADGVYTVDRELRILSFNVAAERITGWQESEVLGRNCAEVLQEQDEYGNLMCQTDCLVRKAMDKVERLVALEAGTVLIGRDGQEIPVTTSAAPLLDPEGQVIGAVAVFRDVSLERTLERMRSEFISSVSHGLLTPLSKINAATELMLKYDLKLEDYREMLEIIQGASASLTKAIQEVLVVSRLEAGEMEVHWDAVKLPSLIEGTINMFKLEAPAYRFVTQIPAKLSLVIGDEQHIDIILGKLVDNAVKYSPEGSQITVRVEETEEEVLIHIIDEGLGIPPEHQELVFEYFYRVDSSDSQKVFGYGLGLYIARKLVKLHGGRMWVQSEVGQGSCFSFSLPKRR